MDKKTTLEMIAAISNANGTSGFEDEVVAAIRPYAEGLGEITEDCMRNLYIRRKENNGKRPVVQLDAHSDEVGFMVQAICPNGTLRIIQLGGWVNHNIPAHKVWVRNRFGEYIPG
ncbi:MAG TPA: peptidase M42, partial [Lachnospiraceae bacterium]|nr:peptidase M42 [Lachnospiraceae bacterium]